LRLDTKLLAAFCAVALPLSWAVAVSARRAVHTVLAAQIESAAAERVPEAVSSLRIGLSARDTEALRDYVLGCLQGFHAAYAAAYGLSGEPAGHTDQAAQEPLADGLQEELSRARAPFSQERLLRGAWVLEYAVPVRSADDRYLGALLLRFPLAHVLATERLIARRVLALSGAIVAAALILLWILTRRMIAALRRTEAQLAQSEKMSLVGQMAAGIAHEINNPLGSILGFAQAAALRVKGTGPLSEPLACIEEEALRCRKLVQDLLAFSRHEQSRLEDIDLNEVVGSVLRMVEAQARLHSVAVASELELRHRVRADRGQIQQIVVNLCGNALDAMPRGGRLMVRTRLAGGDGSAQAVIEVEDTGPGVPPELRTRIFEPFFTTKESGHGTGLGLALVQQIVRRHDGAIAVSSEPGRGAVFTVSLPLARP
jgi:signal transduction histidine kinase